jgi:PKD repeat protein
MKKLLLSSSLLLMFSVGFSQRVTNKVNLYPKSNNNITSNVPQQRTCGTQTPGQEWDNWFNQKVAEFVAANNNQQGKLSSMPSYTIPVVVHVIHNGENVGTGSNISQTQVNSQITVLNADYAGTGFNVNNVPSAFSTLVADCQITFCLAQKDPNGNVLAEPGIHRVNRNTAGFTAPPYSNTSYIDNTIKPQTIWNPSNYLNMWVLNLGGGLLGYATFPGGTGLTGLSGFGTSSTDGVVMGYNYFGNTGNVSAPYNKGRTATHEVGHWLGLRHIWGDSNCGNDFCTDTPTQQAANYGCPSYPNPSCNNTSDMHMNFMDYTDDACMYMFTPNQKTRVQTAMANGTYRSNLSNSSNTVCNSTPTAPTSAFTFPSGTHCTGSPYTFTSTSTGSPTSYSWVASPAAGVTISTATSQNPSITFTNPGTYSISLTVSNTQGSNSSTQTFVVQACATGGCDTISNFDFVNHTAALYGSGTFGYASGHNDYLDKAKADFYPAGSYLPNYRVSGAIYYFGVKHDGAGGATSINCKVWDDNGASGAPSTAFTPSVPLSINSIDVTGMGNLVNFNPPINPNNGGFYVGFDGLVYNGTTGTFDTVAILTNQDGEAAPVTAWEQWSDNSWHSFNDGTNNTWQLDVSLCIAVIMCDATTADIQIINPTKEVVFYPNPAHNTLHINVGSKKEGNVSFKFTNLMGQTVFEKSTNTIADGNYQLSLDTISSGVYFVTVSTPERTVTKKIIIEK